MTKRITKEEGLELLYAYGTPERVIRHCIAVTDAAVALGKALNEHGYDLNIELITGAGIIHDIARVHDDHEKVGAEYALSIGLEEEAAIIRTHMRYPYFNKVEEINETDLVCLADRTVKEDQYVGIDERMEYILNKARSAGATEIHLEKIKKKREETRQFMADIENVIGISVDELCGRKG